jgi:hypothetical protein
MTAPDEVEALRERAERAERAVAKLTEHMRACATENAGLRHRLGLGHEPPADPVTLRDGGDLQDRLRGADQGNCLNDDYRLIDNMPTGDAFVAAFYTPELIDDGRGRIVYTPAERHRCSPPERAPFGSVWRCGCGRRWTCRERPMPVRGMVSTNPCEWIRRYWPWPRC